MSRAQIKRALVAAGLISAAPAFAASESAWEEFRAEVRKACEKAVADRLDKPAIAVDPFGGERYGIAIAKGASKHTSAELTIVCVFDKKTKALETSGEFAQ